MAIAAQLRQLWSRDWTPPRYGKAPYFWLLSFVFFGWKYVYVTPSALELFLVGLSILLFLPIFLYSFWVHDWRVGVCIAITCGLGIVWAGFNPGGSTFVIFAAAMSSRFQHHPRRAYIALGSVWFVVAVCSYVMKLSPTFWVPALIFSIPSAVGAIIGEKLDRANEKLFRKQEEIEHLATLAERERIARDLHDLLGHTLSVITLKAELARKLFDRDQSACQKEIVDIEQTARQALAEVRSAVLGYRDTGLAHELRGARNTLDSANVEFVCELDGKFDADSKIKPLPAAIENVIALALREAITNIIRHSQATVCHCKLNSDNENVYFHLSDNGFEGMEHIPKLEKGNGLTGMSERVRALGGQLQTSCKQGVAIDIVLPLQSAHP